MTSACVLNTSLQPRQAAFTRSNETLSTRGLDCRAIRVDRWRGSSILFCAPGRNRTYDRQIRRLLLYPLSYGGRRTPAVWPARDHCSAQPVSFVGADRDIQSMT